MQNKIHLCQYSSQPDIQIFCDGSWGIPAWNPIVQDKPEEVYELERDGVADGTLYTFEEEKTTCTQCLEKLKQGP